MKILWMILLTGLIVTAGSGAAEPVFHTGVLLEADGGPIEVKVGHLVPCTTDWNGDGNKDLLVGQFSQGRIQLYLNEGSHEKPVFSAGTILEAGGKPIRLDAG